MTNLRSFSLLALEQTPITQGLKKLPTGGVTYIQPKIDAMFKGVLTQNKKILITEKKRKPPILVT